MIGLLTGGIAKYIALGVVGLGLAGWVVTSITAPYRATISKLEGEVQDHREAARKRSQIEAHDSVRADAAETEIAQLQTQLEGLLHEAKPDTCRVSDADRLRLQQLATGRAARR